MYIFIYFVIIKFVPQKCASIYFKIISLIFTAGDFLKKNETIAFQLWGGGVCSTFSLILYNATGERSCILDAKVISIC